MWWLFQSSIILVVAWSNIAYHWTPNGYLVGLLGIGLAYGLTLLLTLAKCWVGKDNGLQ